MSNFLTDYSIALSIIICPNYKEAVLKFLLLNKKDTFVSAIMPLSYIAHWIKLEKDEIINEFTSN